MLNTKLFPVGLTRNIQYFPFLRGVGTSNCSTQPSFFILFVDIRVFLNMFLYNLLCYSVYKYVFRNLKNLLKFIPAVIVHPEGYRFVCGREIYDLFEGHSVGWCTCCF